MKKKILVLILVVALLVMGVVTYKLYNEKEKCLEKIESLTKENEIDRIVLEGIYAPEASDIGYEFDKNGKAVESGNVHETRGTYKTISDNLIEIKFTEETVWDIDTSEETVKNVNRTVMIKYLSENELLVIGENEESSYKIQKYEVEK